MKPEITIPCESCNERILCKYKEDVEEFLSKMKQSFPPMLPREMLKISCLFFLLLYRIAVHCKNKEEYNDFMKLCEKEQLKWSTGESATLKNYWNKYGSSTAITHYLYIGLMYGTDDLYKNCNYQLFEACDILNQYK